MATKIISLSIDEEVLKKMDEMVKSKPEIANRSHFVTVLALKEHYKFLKENKK